MQLFLVLVTSSPYICWYRDPWRQVSLKGALYKIYLESSLFTKNTRFCPGFQVFTLLKINTSQTEV